MPDYVEGTRQDILVTETVVHDILVQEGARIDLIDVAVQGLPGPRGPQGEQGPPGGTLQQYRAATTLSGHRAVMLDANGELVYASSTNAAHMGRVVGITTQAAEAGEMCNVQSSAPMNESSWAWASETDPILLGADGALVQQPDAGAKFLQVLAFPISTTAAFISLREPILLTN